MVTPRVNKRGSEVRCCFWEGTGHVSLRVLYLSSSASSPRTLHQRVECTCFWDRCPGGWQSLSSPGHVEPVAMLLLGRKSEGRKLLPAVPGPILRVFLLPLTEPQACGSPGCPEVSQNPCSRSQISPISWHLLSVPGCVSFSLNSAHAERGQGRLLARESKCYTGHSL